MSVCGRSPERDRGVPWHPLNRRQPPAPHLSGRRRLKDHERRELNIKFATSGRGSTGINYGTQVGKWEVRVD